MKIDSDQIYNILISLGWFYSYGSDVSVGPVLPWHHDIMGSGIWSSMDSGILLLHLALSCSSAVHGNQVFNNDIHDAIDDDNLGN